MSSVEHFKIIQGLKNGELNPLEIFPFTLDNFQSEAIEALNRGFSVVVSAPTGSGKTLIGEYAICRAITHGRKVFYTTPLKALSNQKLRDFREQFGYKNVGLMTGDMSLNREASIIVMTTEIFRNMLYAEVTDHNDPLSEVEAVVLDECHYMNDSQRGTVWEESIIHCPSSIQIVALSATVANGAQLTDWIQRVHGPTLLVASDFRPVPLLFNFCSAKGLHPLLNTSGNGLHPNCKIWRAPKGNKRKARIGKPLQPDSPKISFVIKEMESRNMLPAIYFIFSRRGCDKAVKNLGSKCLVNTQEQELIRKRLIAYEKLNPEALRDPLHSDALIRGIAAHHAGVLPAWKELIEELFQSGLLKVVFATETLAAGINMPARSTVISSLSKRTENGHRALFASEFLQMAGRAGRRGLDSLGYVLTVQNRFEGAREAGTLATSSVEPLVSHFTPSYGMVLNLLQRHPLKKARELVNCSFGRYLASLDLLEEEESIEELRKELVYMEGIAGDVSWEDFEDYEKSRGRLKEERRILRILQKQSAEALANELTLALQFASSGTLVSLKVPQLRGKITPAVIVQKIDGRENFPKLLCLTDQNIWILLPCNSVVSLHAELSCLDVGNIKKPSMTNLGEIRHGDKKSLLLSMQVSEISDRHDMQTPQYDLAAEVLTQAGLVKQLQEELEKHSVHQWGDRKKLKKHRKKIQELECELILREENLHQKANRHWETFLSLLEILKHFGCLEDLIPTDIGRTVASLRGDNELWLGLTLMSGHLDELPPPILGAVFQAISTEVKRPDLWIGFAPPTKALEALHDLSSLKRQLKRSQEKFEVSVPIWWNPDLMGLVNAWACGTSWQDLVANTSLDEGDIVRIMRRTIDLLSQVPYCEAVSEQLRSNARVAVKAINRFPVCEADDLFIESLEKEKSSNPATQRI